MVWFYIKYMCDLYVHGWNVLVVKIFFIALFKSIYIILWILVPCDIVYWLTGPHYSQEDWELGVCYSGI